MFSTMYLDYTSETATKLQLIKDVFSQQQNTNEDSNQTLLKKIFFS